MALTKSSHQQNHKLLSLKYVLTLNVHLYEVYIIL